MTKKSETVDVRDGEVVVRAHPRHGLVSFVSDPALSRGSGQRAYVVPPDVDTILPARLFAGRSDGASMVKSGEIEIVDSGRGVIPNTIDMSDSRLRATVRDGEPPKPGREEEVAAMKAVLVSEGLARCVVETLEAVGAVSHPPSEVMQDDVAASIVRDLVRVYDESFENGTALQEPWLRRAAELAALAGFDLAHPERGRITSGAAQLAPEGGE